MVNVDNRGTGPRDPRGSNSSLYFIVGALVVAVLIIGWFLYGRDGADPGAGAGGATTEAPAAGDTNVTVEDAADAPAGGTNVEVEAPAATTTPAAPAADAPAEPAAPAAPAADAPAAEPAAPATDPAAPAAPAPQ